MPFERHTSASSCGRKALADSACIAALAPIVYCSIRPFRSCVGVTGCNFVNFNEPLCLFCITECKSKPTDPGDKVERQMVNHFKSIEHNTSSLFIQAVSNVPTFLTIGNIHSFTANVSKV